MRRMRHLKPREIQGCALALDASIPSSLYDATSGGSQVAADGAIARWEDQSGSGAHVTQATGANRPQRKLAIQGGGEVVRFDGTNDFLERTPTTGVEPHTQFIVAVRRGAQTDYRVMMNYGGTAGAIFNLRGSTDFVGSYVAADINSTFTAVADAAFTASQRENSGISWVAKGEPAGSAVGNASHHDWIIIGAGYSEGYAFYSQMDCCEAAIYSAAVADYALRRLHHAKMRKWRING